MAAKYGVYRRKERWLRESVLVNVERKGGNNRVGWSRCGKGGRQGGGRQVFMRKIELQQLLCD